MSGEKPGLGPSQVLFQEGGQLPAIPFCDHYAGSEKLMRKSIALQQTLGPIFDITLDCEDGAAAGNEQVHARLVASLVDSAENRYGRIGVRVHDSGSRFFESDLGAVCAGGAEKLAYVVIPKVRSAAELNQAVDIVNRHAAHRETPLPVHVLIETHGALEEVHRIAAIPQVECLSFGIMDFVSSHHGAVPGQAMRSPLQFSHPLIVRAKIEIAAACHAHGKIPSHNVTTEIRDPSVVIDDARRARSEFGYLRMWSIHPTQIEPIVHAFRPEADEISKACRILIAAQSRQWGPIELEGELHDRASYRYYWTLIRRARAGGMHLPDEAAGLH